MKTGSLNTFIKSAMLLLVVGLLAGCGDQPEESSKAGQDAAAPEYKQSDEAAIITTEPSVPADTAAITESVEKSLDELLEEADAVIKKTEEQFNNYDGDAVKTELGEVADSITEESKSYIAATEETAEESTEAAQDGHEIVKATPDLIKKVQQALNDAGFNAGTADGKLGPRTLGALKDYQQQNGMQAGKFTKETLRALNVSF